MPIRIAVTILVEDLPTWARDQMSEELDTEDLERSLRWLSERTSDGDGWILDSDVQWEDMEEPQSIES